MDWLGIPKEVWEDNIAMLLLVVLALIRFGLYPLISGFVRKDERDDKSDERAAEERRALVELLRQQIDTGKEQAKTFAALTETQKAMKDGFADLREFTLVQQGEFFRAAKVEMDRVGQQRTQKLEAIHLEIQGVPETVRSAVEHILTDYEARFNQKIQSVPEETRAMLMPLIQAEIRDAMATVAPHVARLEELSKTLDRLLELQREGTSPAVPEPPTAGSESTVPIEESLKEPPEVPVAETPPTASEKSESTDRGEKPS